MILLTRQGECNKCGGCCGLDADPPWPRKTLERHLNWQYSAWLEQLPHIALLGIVAGTDGRPEVARKRGVTVIQGQEFPYVWHEGTPCQDLAPDKEEPEPTTRCPFLLDADDGTHPCGLIGTEYENYYHTICSGDNGKNARGTPFFKADEKQIEAWVEQFLDCSFTWE